MILMMDQFGPESTNEKRNENTRKNEIRTA